MDEGYVSGLVTERRRDIRLTEIAGGVKYARRDRVLNIDDVKSFVKWRVS